MTTPRLLSALLSTLLLAAIWSTAPVVAVQGQVEPLHRPLDQILDLNVRDGLVYYRALKSERAKLDRYEASLNVAPSTYDAWSRDEQAAFWLNAYNVFVLETVIDQYPIKGRAGAFPSNSIRQIP